MKIRFDSPVLPKSGTLVAGVFEGRTLTPTAKTLDAAMGGTLAKAVAGGRFTGAREQLLELLAPTGVELSRILLVGLGKSESLDALAAEAIGGKIIETLNRSGETQAVVAIDPTEGAQALAPALLAARIATGAQLGAYRFDKYRTTEKPERKPSLDTLSVHSADPAAAEAAFARLGGLAEAVAFTRDLVSEPANVIHPESFVERCRPLAALGLALEVLGPKEMGELGMGALLGVAQGSRREPRLLVLRWQGAAKADEAPVAIVGKGVTFDTGGICIKPAAGMEEMKWDMAGAAVVAGVMKSLAARKARANVIGLCGLVENMPDGNAQRPGDVVKTMNGQTVEVINTDAEGRLVLCDALHYAIDRFKPRLVVDLATLTGAIMISLGQEQAGLFSNDDKLAEQLRQAGSAEGEPLWRMPMGEAYDRQIDSDIADMKNVGGRYAGSITAAQFLARFVGSTPWAHLDIAGMAWSAKDRPTVPKGATGYGVRLLDRFIADQIEPK